jgi:hypothetical protein
MHIFGLKYTKNHISVHKENICHENKKLIFGVRDGVGDGEGS